MKKGLPIAIGYLSVSFTFGVKAVNAGIPVWITILISVANVTSAGQFVLSNASLPELQLWQHMAVI